MDFKELLLEADKNQKIAAKQSQHVKRISTHFTAPVKKEEKNNQPRSEALQKLLLEKEKERQQRKEEEERRRRKEEKTKEKQEREERAKSVFRIPKKSAQEAPASDAESFSSISSDDEPATQKSSSSQSHGEASHKSSSHGRSSDHRGNGSSADKASSKQRSKETSVVESRSKLNGHHGSSGDKHSSSPNHKQSSSGGDKHSSSHSHKQSSSGGDKHSTSSKPKHSSSHSHKHSSSSSGKNSSAEKYIQKRSSSHSDKHLSSDKHKSSSGEHKSDSKTSSQKVHSYRQDKEIKVENDSSGYITSPDITSEEEEEKEDRKGKSSTKALPSKVNDGSNSKKEDPLNTPVTLTRHHLKPTLERKGCSLEERNKVLAKLQSIRDKMTSESDGSPSKRVRGDVKKRRSKREKLEGDFSGSCMEKIDYTEEDKPSLKRPEPKPEELKPVIEKKKLKESPHKKSHKKFSSENDRHKTKSGSSSRDRSSSDSKHSLISKQNRFDAMREKPKKPRPVHRPPPVNFADLLKMAEQKQAVPVTVEVAPKKKEKERRPMTQEEIDRQRAREERVKSQEYKDWYKFGEKAIKSEPSNSAGADATGRSGKDKESGGFLHRDTNIIPPGNDSSRSKASANSSHGNHQPPNVHHNQKPSSFSSRPPPSQTLSSRPSSGFKPQPHPTRPGMIANKPLAMAQHVNNGQKPYQGSARPAAEAKKRPASPEPRSAKDSSPRPRAQAYDTKGGSAWDKLFSRPEYKKLKEPPVKKGRMVIDSEEEDDYNDDMDDFIDDEGEEDMDSVSGAIRQLFGYDKRRYRDEDDDDRNMEVGFSQVMKEEARSARLGRQEDLEDIRKEQEELRLKALKKKKP